MKRSFQSEESETPTLSGVTWLWIDQKGAAKEFTDEESAEIENAFKSNNSLQLGPWTILNLEGVRDGHLYHLIRRPNTSPNAFPLTPDEVTTTPEPRKSKNPEIPPELTSSEITPTTRTSFFCLDPNSEEWTKVARYMQDSFIPDYRRKYGCIPGTQDPPSRFDVIKIERIQAPTTLCEYQNNKAEIKKKGFSNGELQDLLRKKPLALGKDSLLDENANELYLFHGTKNNLVCHIAEEGFTNRYVLEFIQEEADKHDWMFGTGMYFAENSSKSNKYVDCPNCMKGAVGCIKAGTKEFDPCQCTPEDVEKKGGYVMILARVLLGDTHICTFRDYQEGFYKSNCVPPGDKDSIWAEPPEPQFKNTNSKYGISHREFIVFEPENIYPEYLIYYLRK